MTRNVLTITITTLLASSPIALADSLSKSAKSDHQVVCQLDATNRATVSSTRLSTCFSARFDSPEVLRAVTDPTHLATVCPVTVNYAPKHDTACNGNTRLSVGDRFRIDRWSAADFRLSVWAESGRPIASAVPLRAKAVATATGTAYPWLSGEDAYAYYYVYLQQGAVIGDGMEKFFVVEVFNKNESAACLAERPATPYFETCASGGAKQTSTGGGGEPPTGPG